MAECVIGCVLAFLGGGGFGALLMNEVVWRKQRRELVRLRERIDRDALRWDAELDALRADYLAAGARRSGIWSRRRSRWITRSPHSRRMSGRRESEGDADTGHREPELDG
jgi:hypothetical protein